MQIWYYVADMEQQSDQYSESHPKSNSTKLSQKMIQHLLPPWWKFWETLPIAWKYMRSPHIPRNGKIGYAIVSGIMFLYFLSPIDVVPELLLPLVGYVDDLGLVPAWFGLTEMFIQWCQKKVPDKVLVKISEKS